MGPLRSLLAPALTLRFALLWLRLPGVLCLEATVGPDGTLEFAAAPAKASGEAVAGPAENLAQWVKAQGGETSACAAIQSPSDAERGIFATCDLEEDHPVLTLPVRLVLSVRQAAATPLGKALLESLEKRSVPTSDLDGLMLAAFVLSEKANHSSWWAPYLASLPPSFPTTPLNYTEEEAAVCVEGLGLAGQVEQSRGMLRREYEEFFKDLRPSEGAQPVAWQDFMWARLVTLSRTFTVSRLRLNMDEYMAKGPLMKEVPQATTGLGGRKSDEAYVLAPFADMLNHLRGDDVNCRWEYNKNGFAMLTKRPVEKGEQLGISYGEAKPNSMFFIAYGFVEAGNPNDHLDLKLQLGDAAEPVQLKVKGQPAEAEELYRVVSAVRDAARAASTDPELSELDLEVVTLRLLKSSLEREAQVYSSAPPPCPLSCRTLRENYLQLIGTWGNFVDLALDFLAGGPMQLREDPHLRYVLHTRLYFGLWLRRWGQRLDLEEDVQIEASIIGAVRYTDIMMAVGVM